MSIISVVTGLTLDEAIRRADDDLQKWTMMAARGECSWICPDCTMTFPDGMPDKCAHGHQTCTELNACAIAQAKKEANNGG